MNIVRSVFILGLASALAAACSRASSPPSGSAAPASAPAAGAAPAPASGAAPTPAAGAAPAPAPSSPAAPTIREVTIPAETPISVTLVTPIASNKSKVEDQVRGTLAEAIVVDGTTVVPAGAAVTGAVLEANPSGRVKGRATIAVDSTASPYAARARRSRQRASRPRLGRARRVTSRRGPSVPAPAPSSAASRAGDQGQPLARASAGPRPCWRRRARKSSWPPAPRSARGCWSR